MGRWGRGEGGGARGAREEGGGGRMFVVGAGLRGWCLRGGGR